MVELAQSAVAKVQDLPCIPARHDLPVYGNMFPLPRLLILSDLQLWLRVGPATSRRKFPAADPSFGPARLPGEVQRAAAASVDFVVTCTLTARDSRTAVDMPRANAGTGTTTVVQAVVRAVTASGATCKMSGAAACSKAHINAPAISTSCARVRATIPKAGTLACKVAARLGAGRCVGRSRGEGRFVAEVKQGPPARTKATTATDASANSFRCESRSAIATLPVAGRAAGVTSTLASTTATTAAAVAEALAGSAIRCRNKSAVKSAGTVGHLTVETFGPTAMSPSSSTRQAKTSTRGGVLHVGSPSTFSSASSRHFGSVSEGASAGHGTVVARNVDMLTCIDHSIDPSIANLQCTGACRTATSSSPAATAGGSASAPAITVLALFRSLQTSNAFALSSVRI
mmetsp:Transcript_87427/g.282424  ORF Transcript_87427/g.282424 Transcript_87427/m.282424 type:complete len:401 (+) Transcript_87427:494-1696(+)